MTAPLISERVRCTCCPAEMSSHLLAIAPLTHGWTELEGFRFCGVCSPRAADVVALDRERNAHQVTIGQLEQLRERTLTEERVREVVWNACFRFVHAAIDGDTANAIATRSAKELAGATVDDSRVAETIKSAIEYLAALDAAERTKARAALYHSDEAERLDSAERNLRDRIAAFDRAAVAITGRPAAELTAQLQPATASIAPADTALLVEALYLWDRYLTAPHAEIKRILATLTGATPTGTVAS